MSQQINVTGIIASAVKDCTTQFRILVGYKLSDKGSLQARYASVMLPAPLTSVDAVISWLKDAAKKDEETMLGGGKAKQLRLSIPKVESGFYSVQLKPKPTAAEILTVLDEIEKELAKAKTEAEAEAKRTAEEESKRLADAREAAAKKGRKPSPAVNA